jgi:hypothetical protein
VMRTAVSVRNARAARPQRRVRAETEIRQIVRAAPRRHARAVEMTTKNR